MIGSTLGPYEILAPLGSGGMGEVYRARDPRLQREVALKILSDESRENSERQFRFLQEARAASSLKHANILTVYDIGEQNGSRYIVSELVEGDTLRSLIQKGPIPLKRFLNIAVQVGAGLTAAHEAGIVHRDLKPENIMVTRDNQVKLLDFGLSKLAVPATGTAEEQTHSHLLTTPGAILGTVTYMSPEQARGEDIDFRSDQFSFGLILYEMATGKKAFQRNTPVQTLSAIITEEPPAISSLTSKFPGPLRWIIERCLAKDLRERYGATIDLYHELRSFQDHLSETSYTSGEAITPAISLRRHKTLIAAALMLLLGTAAGYLISRFVTFGRRPAAVQAYQFTPLAVDAGEESFPMWSPDGKTLAYSGEVNGYLQLFTCSMSSPTPIQVTHLNTDVFHPVWSKDSSRIYYFARRGTSFSDFDIWSVGAAGGTPELVIENGAAQIVSPDGKTMIFVRVGSENKLLSIWSSSPIGSTPKKLEREGFKNGDIYWANLLFSPDGNQLAVSTKCLAEGGYEFWIIPFPDGKPKLIPFLSGKAFNGISWMPDSHRLVLSGDPSEGRLTHLWIADVEKETLMPLTQGIGEETEPAVSPDGHRIAFASSLAQYDLVSFPLDGSTPVELSSTTVNEKAPAWSPSGTQFAYVSDRTGHDTVWIRSVADRLERPLVTENDFPDQGTISFSRPMFSPDGQRIAYHRNAGDTGTDIWISNLAGGAPVRLYQQKERQFSPAWSPDGNWIAYLCLNRSRWDLVKVRVGGSEPPVLIKSDVMYYQPQWSPNGEWINTESEKGVFIISPDGKSERQISKTIWLTGGWSRDSKLLYSIRQDPNRRLAVYATNAQTGEDKLIVVAGLSPLLTEDAAFAGFSMAPDGKSFATSELKVLSDIWVLENFENQPQ